MVRDLIPELSGPFPESFRLIFFRLRDRPGEVDPLGVVPHDLRGPNPMSRVLNKAARPSQNSWVWGYHLWGRKVVPRVAPGSPFFDNKLFSAKILSRELS